MKTTMKRLFSLFLVLVMLGSMLPAVYAESEAAEPAELTDEDYAIVNDVFARIDAMENEPAKKNATEAQLADAAADIVAASDSYVAGSLERNGNSFTWWTEEGIRCVYSPRMREIESNMVAPENPLADGVYNEPVATKGGWPSGTQVYLIAPYYGYDDTFTDQYKNEATSIASAIGDTDGYTLYSGTAATIDKVAEAMSNGAVVIFDSHGNTDYENGYDYVSGANYSYLCLKSTTGLTTEDYNDGALYYSDGIWITGASIANHMTKQSPAGILWMAICLGMATDTFATPMREMGVEVVYGYSQSVTFAGDYLYEETFWDNMIAGKDVATAISDMKSQWGNWDWSTEIATYYDYTDGYSTISAARADYAAFPIVVSDEDAHPGQRSGTSNYGADSLQTVKSTYTLYSQYNVTVQSNNPAWGTASISGSTITATPATGYFAESATVTSGTATVTQNGNAFTVIAESDCTVQINFAAKTAVTVNFSGANVSGQTGYAGDSMSLPTDVEAPEGYKFVGWTTAPLSDETTEKPSYYTDSFIPTGNTTLYALYSYMEASSDGGTGDYIKVTSTSADMSGEYVIVYEEGSVVMDSSLESLDANDNTAAVTITDSTISAAEGDPYKVTVAAMDGGYSILTAAGTYISGTSGSNKLNTGTEPAANTITIDASGNATITSNTSFLRFNTDASRFRYYKASSYSNQKAIALYVKDGTAGTTYYISTLCEHTNTTEVAAVAATCTETGYTAGVQCTDCGSFVSGHDVIAALGHSFGAWTETTAPGCETTGEQTHTCSVCGETETQTVAAIGHSYSTVVTLPTATEQGYTTYTCTACGHSYVDDYVDALGETFTVSFVVPEGVAAVEDMLCGKAGITLPEAGVPTGAYSYKFAGWVKGTVDNVTAQPEIYTGSFTATENVTLYAVYTYSVGGSGSTAYTLTDLADISAADSVVVTVTYTDGTVYALSSANGTDKAPAATIVTVSGEQLSEDPAEDLKWNIGGSADAYIFYPEGETASWLYCTATNNGVRVGTGTANTFKIDVSTSYLYNNGTGRYLGVYRTNPDWRCYTNTTGNTAGQTLRFYVKGEGGTTYYTTVIGEPCSHENVTTETVDATCTENGSVTVTCDDCGVAISTEVIEAKGHSYTSAVTSPTCTAQGYTTYNCSVCGHNYTDNYVAASGHSYQLEGNTYTCSVCGDSYDIFYVSFSVPQGVAAVEKIEYTDGGIALPSAGTPEGNYVFVGWTEETVDHSTDKPTFYPAGATYEATEAVTLKAVYTYEVADENAGSGDYVKVTEAPADWSGEYLIVYELGDGTGYVYNGSLDTQDALSKANNYVTLNINNNTISAADGDAYKFIVTAYGDAYTMQSVSGMYIGRTATSNGLNASASTVYTNTFDLDSSGHALITCEGDTYLKFNATTAGSYMFRYYATGQKNIELYAKSGSTNTTYYTTVIGEEEKVVESWNISLGDNIGVNFVLNAEEADEVSFSVAGEAVTAVQNGNTYSIYLAAAQMTDEIVIVVNGTAVEETYSVREYADVILTGDYDADVQNLVKAMLCYGGAAQTYFDYNASNLASSGIEFTVAVPAGETEVAVTDNLEGLNFYGASLVHQNKIAVRIYFAGSIDGLTFTANGEACTPVLKNGMYYVEIADILPQQLGSEVSVTVSNGTQTLSVSYSPLTYMIRMYNKAESTDATKALVQALYGYYLAAESYVN